MASSPKPSTYVAIKYGDQQANVFGTFPSFELAARCLYEDQSEEGLDEDEGKLFLTELLLHGKYGGENEYLAVVEVRTPWESISSLDAEFNACMKIALANKELRDIQIAKGLGKGKGRGAPPKASKAAVKARKRSTSSSEE
jgi:hypothetical protein